ncbi:MAG: PEGA domain-containing protein [Hymenobacter sp.]
MTHIKNLIQLQALRLVFMLLVLLVSVTFTAQSSFGQNRNRNLDYGRIELATNPSGYPISIDGKPAGNTSTTVRYIDLAPGTHRVEINFPNSTRFVRDFNIIAGKRECINLNFRPRSVSIQHPAISPCPYTLSVSAPATVNDGSSITFTSNVSYTGKSVLNYMWTLVPSSARITNGAGTQTITVDSTGLGRERITATLSVDDGSGFPNCRKDRRGSSRRPRRACAAPRAS